MHFLAAGARRTSRRPGRHASQAMTAAPEEATAAVVELTALEPDLMCLILSHVPAKGLVRVSLTCREFRDVHVPAAARFRACRLRVTGLSHAIHSAKCGVTDRVSLTWLNVAELLAGRNKSTLAGGHCHSLAVRPEDGSAWAWGGQEQTPTGAARHIRFLEHLGIGIAEGPNVASPTPCTGLGGLRVSEVSAGWAHSLLLVGMGVGRVYSCGAGRVGQLGHGDTEVQPTPRPIEGIALAVQVSAGGDTSLVLLCSTHVLAFGDGGEGQLGMKALAGKAALAPVCICEGAFANELDGEHIVQVSMGESSHALAVSDVGHVYSWGSAPMSIESYAGVLGLGDRSHYGRSRGRILAEVPERVPMPKDARIREACAGGSCSLAVDFNGQVYVSGAGHICCQGGKDCFEMTLIGGPLARERVHSVSAGSEHCVAVTESGEVFAWGSGEFGQLGIGDRQPAPFDPWDFFGEEDADMAGFHDAHEATMASRRTPVRLKHFTSNFNGSRVREVDAGKFHTLFRLDDDSVFSCGYDRQAQLGQQISESYHRVPPTGAAPFTYTDFADRKRSPCPVALPLTEGGDAPAEDVNDEELILRCLERLTINLGGAGLTTGQRTTHAAPCDGISDEA